jgi:hypothetical protein
MSLYVHKLSVPLKKSNSTSWINRTPVPIILGENGPTALSRTDCKSQLQKLVLA